MKINNINLNNYKNRQNSFKARFFVSKDVLRYLDDYACLNKIPYVGHCLKWDSGFQEIGKKIMVKKPYNATITLNLKNNNGDLFLSGVLPEKVVKEEIGNISQDNIFYKIKEKSDELLKKL